jgi:hypothetical protein
MGSYDDASGAYAVAASTLSLWAGLFGLMYVGRLSTYIETLTYIV